MNKGGGGRKRGTSCYIDIYSVWLRNEVVKLSNRFRIQEPLVFQSRILFPIAYISLISDDQKRKERELQFLRRQNEKQQRDLEKRRKMTEQANQQGQERQLKESLAQEQKKLEAAARRERIMAQYLEKKRQKELEEKGLASSHGQAVAKGVIGGGPQGNP